ncbi:hypothetical protein CA603_03380 [Paraburkholderia hospita]|nr:hypothetical protein CA603_03380 [Paraburkholderia hospita]
MSSVELNDAPGAVARSEAASNAYENIAQVFLRTRFDDAHAEAAALAALSASGVRLPLAGLALAVKACFDVAGWVTDAASNVLSDQPPAQQDAPLVASLRAAGATVVAHTNMTEFAFGALGVNSFRGTPRTPLDPQGERVAGGSTSGGAVAVAAGLADIALGSDTSGSVRIPAAFCGLAGYKPSKGILSAQGCIPLSTTFDVPGFIARDVDTLLRVVDAVGPFARKLRPVRQQDPSLEGLRFAIPKGFAVGHCDRVVRGAFARALELLTAQGASIVETEFTDLRAPSRIALESGIIVADAYTWHADWLRTRADRYDPLVGPRISKGEGVAAHRYLSGLAALEDRRRVFADEVSGYDALLTPTVPVVPPKLDDLRDSAEYLRVNALVFSLTELANRIDLPSVSLPLERQQSLPVGLLLTGRPADDPHLLLLARRLEAALS